MADLPEDYDMITSFANPNYTMITDDVLNSNLPTELYDNGHIYEDVRSPQSTKNFPDNPSTKNTNKGRKKYAQMNLSSMGIELPGVSTEKQRSGSTINTPDSVTSMESESQDSAYSGGMTSPEEKTSEILAVEHTEDDTEDEEADWKPKGFLGYYANLERNSKTEGEKSSAERESGDHNKTTQHPSKSKPSKDRYDDKTKVINSPDSNDSGIQADVHHIRGPINDDIYAVVDKTNTKRDKNPIKKEETDENSVDGVGELPSGWERHEDEDGPYYWHIKSGTIQRDPPTPPLPRRQLSLSDSDGPPPDYRESCTESSASDSSTAPPGNEQEEHLQEFESHAFKYATESIKSLSKHKSERSRHSPRGKETGELPIRFAVRSLGWVQIPEEDLTPEKSSKAVNKCIVDLSLGRNDINDVVGRWGDGKDLYMDLDEQSLILIDPQDVSVLNLQPIQSIRVWGVGRDNGRDFAYVARDRATRKHMCHVFRCDTPARQIANTLRDICQKIMLERSKGIMPEGANMTSRSLGITRPNKLPVNMSDGQKITFESLFNNTSFPTPMEEPKKVIRCHYLGTAQVTRPSGKAPHGIEVLNGAAEKVYSRVPPEKWMFVSVAVAPSTITITEHGKPENTLAECRVRFLSFMGIAQKNVKLCSFIMHTAQDQFVAHVFHCEPSAGALCKTIEAACKLRYQKCLDSHQNDISEAAKKAASAPSKASSVNPPRLTSQIKAGAQNLLDIFKKKAAPYKLHH